MGITITSAKYLDFMCLRGVHYYVLEGSFLPVFSRTLPAYQIFNNDLDVKWIPYRRENMRTCSQNLKENKYGSTRI